MKKIALLPLLVLGLLFGGTQPASAEINVGTVDMKKIFEGFWRTKEAETKMNEIRAGVKRELDERSEKRKALEAEIMKFNEDLKKTELTDAKKSVIAKDREKKIAEWQDVSKELQAFTQEQDKALSDKTLRIRNGIVEEIKKVVDGQALSAGYDLVFDISGNSINNVAVVIYANAKYDFTKIVLDKLNAERPKGGASEAPEASPLTPPAPATPEKKK
jgi:outer membrane protein